METNFSSFPIFISSAAKDTRAAAGKTAFSEAISPPSQMIKTNTLCAKWRSNYKARYGL